MYMHPSNRATHKGIHNQLCIYRSVYMCVCVLCVYVCTCELVACVYVYVFVRVCMWCVYECVCV